MPRVHVQKAGKDYPAYGIEKGQTYYWWKFRHGGKVRSAKRPRPSQLTQSKWSGVYAAHEGLHDSLNELKPPIALDDIVSLFEDCAGDVESVGEEYRESADAIRDSFSESPTADQCDERADHLADLAEQLRDVESELPEPDEDTEDPPESVDLVQTARDFLDNLDFEPPC